MVTHVNDSKPVNEENKILGQKDLKPIAVQATKKIKNNTKFIVLNTQTSTKAIFEWDQVRHMFAPKIEKLIYDTYPKKAIFDGYEVEPFKDVK